MASIAGLVLIAGCSSVGDHATDGAIAGPWNSADVGNVTLAGETVANETGTRLEIQASGGDASAVSDSLRFVYKELPGAGSITVRVDAIEAADASTKVGVMVREDVTEGARNAFLLFTADGGVALQARPTAGGETHAVVAADAADVDLQATPWLKLERAGDTLTGYVSADGVDWTELGRVELPLGEAIYVGAAVSSTATDATSKATLSNVTLATAGLEAGDGPLPRGPVGPMPAPSGPTSTVSYDVDRSAFPNPERGWYVEESGGSYDDAAAAGHRLAMRYVRLDDYRYEALPQSFLDDLRSDFESARGSGVKLIVRFAYNRSRDDDAPVDTIVGHIDQLAPVLQEYTDVIAVVQGGFIGAWGEWHSSTNDLLDLDKRSAITEALLDAVDESRMIQIRYPYRARDMFPTPPDENTAFDASDAARVGQLNDCFLATGSDGGTFVDPEDYTYAELVTPFTVMGGETCSIGGLSERNDCETAMAELPRYHWDYMNSEFYTGILDKWRDQGCHEEITRRLGYRYVLEETTSEQSVQAGQTLEMTMTMRNDGYGKLYNPRPMNIVLTPRDGGDSVVLRAYDDARQVLPLSGETRDIGISVPVPAGLAAGEYDAHLRLPDAAETLADDPRYSIRLANTDVWNADTGANALHTEVAVTQAIASAD